MSEYYCPKCGKLLEKGISQICPTCQTIIEPMQTKYDFEYYYEKAGSFDGGMELMQEEIYTVVVQNSESAKKEKEKTEKCPFCGSQYYNLDTENCPTCGYDLSEYNQVLKDYKAVEEIISNKPQEPEMSALEIIGVALGLLLMLSVVLEFAVIQQDVEPIVIIELLTAFIIFACVKALVDNENGEYQKVLKIYEDAHAEKKDIQLKILALKEDAKGEAEKKREAERKAGEEELKLLEAQGDTVEEEHEDNKSDETDTQEAAAQPPEKDNSLPVSRVVSTGAFGDALKARARSKEEYESKQDKEEKELAERNAKILYENIKNDILEEASKGNYKIINRKKVVDYTYKFTSVMGYQECDFYEKDRTCDRMYGGGRRGHATYTYQLKEDKTIHYFLHALENFGKCDDIDISPCMYDTLTETPHSFPFVLQCAEHDFAFDEIEEVVNYVFSVRCRCIIPDEYSTDKPITITETEGMSDGEEGNDNNRISIDTMEGHDFEYFCANVIEKNGFNKVEVTRGSGDQGIDIIAYRDGVKYGIQCKRQSNDVGNKAVQEAFSGKIYYNCHVGVVLTNRYFTASAVDLAEINGIILWDRAKLLTMIEIAGIQVE